MAVEFDHVFICASPAGHEAGGLTTFGLQEGTPNTHPGQGTACRRFLFRNAYLELLWVSDMAKRNQTQFGPRTFGSAGRGGAKAPVHSVLVLDRQKSTMAGLLSLPGITGRPIYQTQ